MDGAAAGRCAPDVGTIHYTGPHYERNVGTGSDTTEKVSKYYRELGRVSRLVALRRKVNDSYEGLRYIVPDHLGGTIRVVDTAGTTIDDIRYHAFGGTRSGGTATPTDKLFTGQTMDASTGLYFYGARYYDAVLGRFLAPDRAGPDLTKPQSLNKYSYVLNNPVKYTDPTGNEEVYDDWGAAGDDSGGGGDDGGGGDWGGGDGGGGDGGYPGDGGGTSAGPTDAEQDADTTLGYSPQGYSASDYSSLTIGATGVIDPRAELPSAGTEGVGLSIAGGALGHGGAISFMDVYDSQGDEALAITVVGGGYGGVGVGVNLSVQKTNAASVADLSGFTSQVGGSYTQATPLIVGPNLGGDLIIQKGAVGVDASAGIGLGTPLEMHGFAGNTWLIFGPGRR